MENVNPANSDEGFDRNAVDGGEDALESSQRRALLSQAALAAGMLVAVGLSTSSAEAQAKSWADCENPNAGSEELLKALKGSNTFEGHKLSKDHVLELVSIIRKTNAKLVDWCQYGQPAVDGVCGAVHVMPDQLGGLIEALAGKPHLWRWGGVFPLGIPFPDRYAFRFGIGAVPNGGVIIHG
jgi:hypothetical protein